MPLSLRVRLGNIFPQFQKASKSVACPVTNGKGIELTVSPDWIPPLARPSKIR
jgi:hypothetical protein